MACSVALAPVWPMSLMSARAASGTATAHNTTSDANATRRRGLGNFLTTDSIGPHDRPEEAGPRFVSDEAPVVPSPDAWGRGRGRVRPGCGRPTGVQSRRGPRGHRGDSTRRRLPGVPRSPVLVGRDHRADPSARQPPDRTADSACTPSVPTSPGTRVVRTTWRSTSTTATSTSRRCSARSRPVSPRSTSTTGTSPRSCCTC